MPANQIQYSEKYYDSIYEVRPCKALTPTARAGVLNAPAAPARRSCGLMGLPVVRCGCLTGLRRASTVTPSKALC